MPTAKATPRAAPPDTQGQEGTLSPMNESATDRKGIVAIDPGIRTFATCYDPAGKTAEWGRAPRLLGWLSRKCDRMQTKATKLKGRRKRRVRKAAEKIREKITNLVTELHRQFSLWLCRNYDVVILPRFRPSSIAKRKDLPQGKKRVITRKMTEDCFSWVTTVSGASWSTKRKSTGLKSWHVAKRGQAKRAAFAGE